jgi:hypothetical protein
MLLSPKKNTLQLDATWLATQAKSCARATCETYHETLRRKQTRQMTGKTITEWKHTSPRETLVEIPTGRDPGRRLRETRKCRA